MRPYCPVAHSVTPPCLRQVRYVDDDGGLLDVEHDLSELAKTPASEWKRLFDSRTARNRWPYGSGVWSKKEWVLPVSQLFCSLTPFGWCWPLRHWFSGVMF